MVRVGVFDSGIGGRSVANAIEKALPNIKVTFVNDREHVPYGSKTPEELYGLVLPILQKIAEDSDVIVVACNTVSTTLIDQLRTALPVPLIAMEQMVKPAAEQTTSGVIAVCATPTTLASARYKQLKETYAQGIKVIEPDCKDWTSMIENNTVDQKQIRECIDEACKHGADVIVLGCTHYHWIEDIITELAGSRALVIQPEQAVVKQVQKVISGL